MTNIFCTINDSDDPSKFNLFFDSIEVPTEDAKRWISKLIDGVQGVINDLELEIRDNQKK